MQQFAYMCNQTAQSPNSFCHLILKSQLQCPVGALREGAPMMWKLLRKAANYGELKASSGMAERGIIMQPIHIYIYMSYRSKLNDERNNDQRF